MDAEDLLTHYGLRAFAELRRARMTDANISCNDALELLSYLSLDPVFRRSRRIKQFLLVHKGSPVLGDLSFLYVERVEEELIVRKL